MSPISGKTPMKKMRFPQPPVELEKKLLQIVVNIRCDDLIEMTKNKSKPGRNRPSLATKNKRKRMNKRKELLATGSNVYSSDCRSVPRHRWIHLITDCSSCVLVSIFLFHFRFISSIGK